MRAKLVLHEKKILQHKDVDKQAIAEIKVWQVDKSTYYPEGIKYSLFLIETGTVLLGFDNHKPKKHHLHIGNTEIEYKFTSAEKLLQDFWKLVSEKGYEQ